MNELQNLHEDTILLLAPLMSEDEPELRIDVLAMTPTFDESISGVSPVKLLGRFEFSNIQEETKSPDHHSNTSVAGLVIKKAASMRNSKSQDKDGGFAGLAMKATGVPRTPPRQKAISSNALVTKGSPSRTSLQERRSMSGLSLKVTSCN